MGRPNPADMAMHNLRPDSQDAVARIGVVLRIAGKPVDLRQRLAIRVTQNLADVPVLSHVIAGSGRSRRWSPVEPDLGVHIVEHELAAGEDMEHALQRVARLPLPDRAPQWDVHILSGYQEDEYSLFVRAHHAVLDGGGLVYLLERLFYPHVLPSGDYSSVAGRLEPGRVSGRGFAEASRLLARNAARTDFWRKAGREPSTQRCFRWANVPRSVLGATARAQNITVNDVYVAAYAQALWSWAAANAPGLATEDLGLIIPVNLRRVEQLSIPGNYTAAARVTLSAGTSGTGELIAEVGRALAPVKLPSVRHALAALTNHTPMALYSMLWRVLLTPTRATPAASNVVIRHPLQFDGDPVLTVTPLMPLPDGFPCTAVLLSYQDTASLCVASDPALPGMDTLHKLWQQAVQDMAGEVSGSQEIKGAQR